MRISWTHLRRGDVFLVGWGDFLQLGDESSQHTAVVAGHGRTRREGRGGEHGGTEGKHTDVHILAECGIFLGLLLWLFSDQLCHSIPSDTLNLS